jgi:hypothetical protein
MHTQKPQRFPKPTPRILNSDEAAREIGGVVNTYSEHDPRIRDLINILVRLDMILFVGDGWLAQHPARGE